MHVVDVPAKDATSVTQTSVALAEVAVGAVAELLPVPVPSGWVAFRLNASTIVHDAESVDAVPE